MYASPLGKIIDFKVGKTGYGNFGAFGTITSRITVKIPSRDSRCEFYNAMNAGDVFVNSFRTNNPK